MNYYRLLKYIDAHKGVADDVLQKKFSISENELNEIAQGSDLNLLFRCKGRSELSPTGCQMLEEAKTSRRLAWLSILLAAIAAAASVVSLFLR